MSPRRHLLRSIFLLRIRSLRWSFVLASRLSILVVRPASLRPVPIARLLGFGWPFFGPRSCQFLMSFVVVLAIVVVVIVFTIVILALLVIRSLALPRRVLIVRPMLLIRSLGFLLVRSVVALLARCLRLLLATVIIFVVLVVALLCLLGSSVNWNRAL